MPLYETDTYRKRVSQRKEGPASQSVDTDENHTVVNNRENVDADNNTVDIVLKIYGVDRLNADVAAAFLAFYSEVFAALSKHASCSDTYELYITKAREGCFEFFFQFIADFLQNISYFIGQLPIPENPLDALCDSLDSFTRIAIMRTDDETHDRQKNLNDEFAEKVMDEYPQICEKGTTCKNASSRSSEPIESASFQPANCYINTTVGSILHGCVRLTYQRSKKRWNGRLLDGSSIIVQVSCPLQKDWDLLDRPLPLNAIGGLVFKGKREYGLPLFKLEYITSIYPKMPPAYEPAEDSLSE